MEIAKKYGLDGRSTRIISPNVKSIENGYLPTKADCEKAVEELLEDGESGVDEEDVLDRLESNFRENDVVLKGNWRMITAENIKLWFDSDRGEK